METLDEILDRMKQDCIDEIKKKKTEDNGTEQFSEIVEKYTRKTFDDDER